MEEKPFAAVKVLIFQHPNAEGADCANMTYFIHNSVDGVQRLTFGEYWRLLHEPHEFRIESHRVDYDKSNELARADYDIIWNSIKSRGYNMEPKAPNVMAAFRNLWYGATGEVMSL